MSGRASRSVRRARTILALGAFGGFALALGSILERGDPPPIPRDAVAAVNGSPVRAGDFERAVEALQSDRREPLTDAERRRVLERLIDEELLLQRARELGLDRHDRTVRSQLVAAMIESIVARGANEPTEREAAAFYRENATFFAPLEQAWIREVRFGVSDARPEDAAREAASRAAARLRAGEDFDRLAKELGDPPVAALPQGLLPLTKLREYLGPSVAERALRLGPGEVSDPIRGPAGFHVVEMVERRAAAPAPLADVIAEVRAEMRRRGDERAVREYLDELRERATIAVREP